MTRPKIRTIVAALVAAFAVAAAMAPVASAGPVPNTDLGELLVTQGTAAPTDVVIAARNDGRYGRSSEAMRKRLCGDLQSMFDVGLSENREWNDLGNLASDKGYSADAAHYWGLAQQALEGAERAMEDMSNLGC